MICLDMMTVAAVLIVKNEEEMLARCLDSVKGVDEIVICDTGSTDKTVEIAKKYTDQVVFRKWDDSFAKARNYAKSFAKSDWILSIDADEILHDFSKVKEAIALAEKQKALAVSVWMIASDNKQKFRFPRLFKNVPQVQWERDIHNILTVNGVEIGDVRITHTYSPAHLNDKNRAFRILQKVVRENPDAMRETFYLAREYFYRHDYEKAVQLFGLYVQRSRYLPEKAEAFLQMAHSYWEMHMPNDARDALVQALIINPHFKEAVKFMAILAGKGTGDERWEHNAEQWEKMAETADNRDVLFERRIA